jgi:hypothetical protein
VILTSPRSFKWSFPRRVSSKFRISFLSATTKLHTQSSHSVFDHAKRLKSRTFSIDNIFSKNHRVTKLANGTYSVHILIIYFSKTHFNITQPIYFSVSQRASTLEDFTPLASQHHRSKNCRQKTQWCYKLRTYFSSFSCSFRHYPPYSLL